MKKCLFMLPALALVFSSCQRRDFSSTNSDDLYDTTPNTADSSTSTGNTTSLWSQAVNDAMILIIGESLPYINEFGTNYLYTTGTIYQSSIPYINVYFKNGTNLTTAYSNALVQHGYIYETTEADYETGDLWKYYYKEIDNASTIEVKFSYYSSGADKYFDIYAYVEGNIPGEIPIPQNYDYIITPQYFGTKGYPETDTSLEINHISNGSKMSLTYKYVMNQNNTVQFKNGTGVVYNRAAINNLKYLYLEYLSDFNRITVEKGTSLSNMTVVTSFNNVYDLRDATFFRIKSSNLGIVSMSSIQIILK